MACGHHAPASTGKLPGVPKKFPALVEFPAFGGDLNIAGQFSAFAGDLNNRQTVFCEFATQDETCPESLLATVDAPLIDSDLDIQRNPNDLRRYV